MRRTRLRWMYLPHHERREEKDHPMQVQNSEQFLRTAAVIGTLTCFAASFMALRKVQTRRRQSHQELVRKRTGQKVVVIGAGAGGCATAALIANAAPDVRITVIEKDRQQVFQGQVPLAHVGHRSYDLGTTTGVDLLRSPTTWNVTRDANLVAAEVLRVDPDKKCVYVRSSPGMLTSAKPLTEEELENAKMRAAATNTVSLSSLMRWWCGASATPSAISVNEDGSPNLSDGTTVFSYDVLVVAAGAQRTVGHLRDQLLPHQIDSYRIAVNPGTTRDSLASIFAGNVVHVKMPPASFVWQMEAARELIRRGSRKGDDGCTTLDLKEQKPTTAALTTSAPPSTIATSVDLNPLAASGDTTVLSSIWFTVRGFLGSNNNAKKSASAADVEGSVSFPDEVALRLAAKHGNLPSTSVAQATATPAAGSSWPLFLLSQWYMHFSTRQHDGTFVSSTNTIWRYLWYYNKLSLCHLFAVTADAQPMGPAPRQVNEVIECFWRERQLGCRQGSNFEGDRFHVLFHSYVTAIDNQANTVTLYDYKNNAEVRVPYHLLLLDLPLRAPAFVRQSGLHRTRYVEDCVLPALAEVTHTAVAGPPPMNIAISAATSSGSATSTLSKNPLLGKTKAELETIFADEASFMDVDPFTLQHRRYSDVFAVGDVAGLPSAKSYGAVFAQVPVVAHNVRQELKAQQQQQLVELKAKGSETEAQITTGASAMQTTMPRSKARYTGYSSFHVIMTTWRAMWPEMRYAIDPHVKPAETTSSLLPPSPGVPTNTALSCSEEETELRKKEKWDLVAPLVYCDHHIWNNIAWRDPRGFLNGLYYQSALYELMYFFVFSRGQWHSPTWFSVPTFSTEDGTPSVPSLVNFL